MNLGPKRGGKNADVSVDQSHRRTVELGDDDLKGTSTVHHA